MSKVVIRQAVDSDCLSLAPRLREEDSLELYLSTGKASLDTLRESMSVSKECFAAEEDGVVIAMGGFSILEGTTIGVPWLVGSPEIVNHPVTLVAAGRVAIDRWAKQCSVMTNLTHTDNHVHHRWLRHLGFHFTNDEVRVGPTNAPFIQFYRHS